MKKQLLSSFLIFISFSSISFAQVTKEQADEIIYKYIVDEKLRTDCLLLYTIDNLSNAEGISKITNYNNETFSVEYSCWVYYINEWMDVNGPYFRRYLFVNKTTGNILEVKTRKDFGPSDPSLENWQLMIYPKPTGLSDIDGKLDKLYFPNPVNDFLEIACKKDFEYVVIFDLQGKQVFQETFKQRESNQKFDVSSLNRGLYVVNIFDTAKKILSFKFFKK
ncbi:MAG: T9SS type A sorting domain-containing protein [Bacteroidales bacterium]|nr:T9SS type A sorting domain-containing protein [Bacteroidales bacterium]